MFNSFKLVGQSQTELNTELRFLFASAKVDKNELLRLDLPLGDSEKENSRINTCVIKVLRVLKKDGVIAFYVNREGFLAGSTEAIYLQNKFGEHLEPNVLTTEAIYVKL